MRPTCSTSRKCTNSEDVLLERTLRRSVETWNEIRVSPVLGWESRDRSDREKKKHERRLPKDEESAQEGEDGKGKERSCRLTNYTRSTRFTGDALSETIVHPRSLLYLFTLPHDRLCPLVNRQFSSNSFASFFVPREAREKDRRTRRSASRRERKGDGAVFVVKKRRNADRRKGIRFQSDNRVLSRGLARRA